MQRRRTGSSKSPRVRTDEFGRAFAGSQLQIQIAVARRPAELSRLTARAIGLPATSSLVWTSPLEERCFAEYRDGAFLHAVGLEHLAASLHDFWPRPGPSWDGLARIKTDGAANGVVLVEAKSYPKEMEGRGCQAKPASLKQIRHALEDTKRWFGVPESADWLGSLYQFANRLAHVYFLRELNGIPAWLANLCIIDDPTWKATSRDAWTAHMPTMRERLGFGDRRIPWVRDVFLPGRSRSELFTDDPASEICL